MSTSCGRAVHWAPPHSTASFEELPVEHSEIWAEPNCGVALYRFGVHPGNMCVCLSHALVDLNWLSLGDRVVYKANTQPEPQSTHAHLLGGGISKTHL